MPDHMTRAQMLPLLQHWQRRHVNLSAQMHALSALVGGGFDGPLFSAVWLTWDDYTAQLAHRIGDDSDWLQWYCGENDMGRKGLTVESWTRAVKVRNLRQLARVIADGREG